MTRKELKNLFEKSYFKNEDLEITIQKMKDIGASQMECTRTLISCLDLPLSKADKIVVNSKAWKENKDLLEKFRDDLFEAATINKTNSNEGK